MVRIWHAVKENQLAQHIPVNPLNINTHYASEHDARWKRKRRELFVRCIDIVFCCLVLTVRAANVLDVLSFTIITFISDFSFIACCGWYDRGVAVGSNGNAHTVYIMHLPF